MKKVLFYLVQWTWGLTVNLAGLLAHLFVRRKGRTERFQKAIITFLPWNFGGLSLGLFIFMADHKNERWTYNTRIHEYGHTFQCLLLGPLYWLVIALPSAIWCNCFQAYRQKTPGFLLCTVLCKNGRMPRGERFSGLSFRGEMK